MKIEKGKSVVYTLIDPKTKKVFYVGQTKNPSTRLQAHLRSPCNPRMKMKINQMNFIGLKPIFKIVEVCDSLIARRREDFWINHYSKFRILNGCFISTNEFYEIQKRWILKLNTNESITYGHYLDEDLLAMKCKIKSWDSSKIFICVADLKNNKITTKLIKKMKTKKIDLKPEIHEKMSNLFIGGSYETDSGNYSILLKSREKLRLNGFDFTFKIGKGRIITRRIA